MAGPADIQIFEKQLENYSFLGWFNNFLKLRNDTRSNLKNDDNNVDSSRDEENEKDEMPAECQTQSQMHQSYPSKERGVQAWRVLKKAQAENKASPIWCQVVAQTRKKSEKKIPTNRMIQQKFLKLLTNAFKKSQQFSQKKWKKVKMRFLVIWLLQNRKVIAVLFWRLSLNKRWIISFSSIKCLIYNKMLNQIPSYNLHPIPFSLQLCLLRVMVQYLCRTRMEEISIVTIQVWAVMSGTVKTWTCVFLLLYIATGYKTL